MAERDTIFSEKMKYTGIWDFKETYRFVWDWFADKDYKLVEKGYTEKLSRTGRKLK